MGDWITLNYRKGVYEGPVAVLHEVGGGGGSGGGRIEEGSREEMEE
jgi:hypothetical protein